MPAIVGMNWTEQGLKLVVALNRHCLANGVGIDTIHNENSGIYSIDRYGETLLIREKQVPVNLKQEGQT